MNDHEENEEEVPPPSPVGGGAGEVHVNIDAGEDDDDDDDDEATMLLSTQMLLLQVVNAVATSSRDVIPTIHRVIPKVRSENGAAYDPEIIAIGPYHRKKRALEGMDGVKSRFLRDLLAKSKLKQPADALDGYIAAVTPLEQRARKQYAGDINMESSEFVKMLVLDGCFVIELLTKVSLTGTAELYGDDGVDWDLSQVRNDLIVSENQLPFFVLDALYKESDLGSELLELKELAFIFLTRGVRQPPEEDLAALDVQHLLHLYHWSLVSCVVDVVHDDRKPFSCWRTTKAVFSSSCRQRPVARRKEVDGKLRPVPRMIPRTTELQNSGIVFKKKKHARCFLDVSFDIKDGVMEIPTMVVEDTTASMLGNLIAFEQRCPAAGNCITSYMALMDNLIGSPEDLAALKNSGIMEMKLGSRRDLAVVFFNTICRGWYIDDDEHHFAQLFADVEEYSEYKWHRWRAALVRDYFGSPWALISVVAAVLVIALTAVSTFYTVYAYYSPHS